MSTISASTTTTTGFVVTSNTTGTLVLQTGASPTTAVTIDGSQNVGIGTSSPAAKLDVVGIAQISSNIQSSGNPIIYSYNGASAGTVNAGIQLVGSDPSIRFSISNAEKMRLDASGNLLVGTTSAGGSNSNSVFIAPALGAGAWQHASGTASGTIYAVFNYNAGSIGSITQNGTTGVLYNLTSDYRLKNDQQPLTGAKEFVMALQPKKWQWWDGSGEGVGFIAHEFMEVAKYSGNGEKDAVDADGNPVYQSIQPSSSEVMANLVAFIQELKAELDAAKADIATLKGAA